MIMSKQQFLNGVRKPLYTAHFGMQVFFNGDYYTLVSSAGGVAATVNRPIAGVYFIRHSLTVSELIDITECFEWFLLHSDIPVVAANKDEIAMLLGIPESEWAVHCFKDKLPEPGRLIEWRFVGEFDSWVWSRPVEFLAKSSLALPGLGNAQWRYCQANDKP